MQTFEESHHVHHIYIYIYIYIYCPNALATQILFLHTIAQQCLAQCYKQVSCTCLGQFIVQKLEQSVTWSV